VSDKTNLLHRILIVDDNAAIHDDFRKVLTSEQVTERALRDTAARIFQRPASTRDDVRFDLTCTRRGQDGLELLRSSMKGAEPFALAFVDVRMPDGWNGIETIQRFWRIDPSLQVVICTAYSDFSWREIRERLGRSDRLLILKKPLDPFEVRQLTHSLCDRARTEAQLRLSSRDLTQRAHLAGMAEVASAVLHNVGNVLNSLNVSASLLREKIEHSRLDDLRRVADLVIERREALTALFREDPAGRLLPDLIAAVTETLKAEQVGQLTDLDHVVKGVAHIREVIQVQQNYAGASALREVARPEALLDDALSLCRVDIDLLGARIVREVTPGLPDVMVDRHSVLEILINALRNAREAMEAFPAEAHVLTLRASLVPNGGVRLSVGDTGMGIAPENTEQLFTYGFTTKSGGHGFGLHHAAIAARKMGGVLRLDSAGPGLGATCSLELPTADSTSPDLNA
jgi:C4-dicarboxylate-specific signal transduction histidine kinase